MTQQSAGQEVAGQEVAGIREREALLWQVWVADGHPEAWEAWKAASRALRVAVAQETAGGDA